MPKAISRLGQWVRDARYWLRSRFHPRYRFHVVNTGLPPGYHDCDSRMLHACMALLSEYVEHEHDGAEELSQFSVSLRANPDPHAEGADLRQADLQDEAVAIYRWWKHERPADLSARQDSLMKWYRSKGEAAYAEFRRLEEKVLSDEESMLLRLMAIRRTLWT